MGKFRLFLLARTQQPDKSALLSFQTASETDIVQNRNRYIWQAVREKGSAYLE